MFVPSGFDAPLPYVSPLGPWGSILPAYLTASPTSRAYGSANAAYYYPITLPVICAVRRLWWVNGATVNASYNLDVGVYADAEGQPGTRLVSAGSTAQGTASQVQWVDVTDTALPAGPYWLAIACSTTSATVFGGLNVTAMDAGVMMQQATAMALPATATPVEVSGGHVYLFGFATTASP